MIAHDAVRAVHRALGRRRPRTRTDTLRLAGGDIRDLDAEVSAARAATGADDIAAWMVRAYGSAWHQVWARTQEAPGLARRLTPTLPYTAADVLHAVEAEFACTIADVLMRRVHLAFELRDHGTAVAPRVAAEMAPLLGWTDCGEASALDEYAADVERIFSIDPTP